MLIKVKKKGKTRGRPSKVELMATAILNKVLMENEGELQKMYEDCVLYGKYGALKMTGDGELKYESLQGGQ
jgi:hypothetical protein